MSAPHTRMTLVLTAAVLLALQGCGSDEQSSTPATGLSGVPLPPGSNPGQAPALQVELVRDGFSTSSQDSGSAPALRMGEVIEVCATAAQAGFLSFWDRRAASPEAALTWSRLYPLDGVLQVQAGQRLCLRELGQEIYASEASSTAAVIAHWTARQEHAAPPATPPDQLQLPAGASALAEVSYRVTP